MNYEPGTDSAAGQPQRPQSKPHGPVEGGQSPGAVDQSLPRMGAAEPPSLSIIVPSMNEELNLENTMSEIRAALDAARDLISDAEFILVNDGSTDKTGEIIDRFAADHADMRAVHHPTNRGLGAAYKSGVSQARNEYLFWIPGENTVPSGTIAAILGEIGKADLVIPYPLNPATRSRRRQLVSRAFQGLTASLTSHKIRYYNGPGLFRRDAVLSALPRTNGHAFQLEMIVTLLKRGHGFVETGMVIRDRPAGVTKALRPMNVLRVIGTLLRLKFGFRISQPAPQRIRA